MECDVLEMAGARYDRQAAPHIQNFSLYLVEKLTAAVLSSRRGLNDWYLDNGVTVLRFETIMYQTPCPRPLPVIT